MLLFA